jgi:hypothetical protein
LKNGSQAAKPFFKGLETMAFAKPWSTSSTCRTGEARREELRGNKRHELDDAKEKGSTVNSDAAFRLFIDLAG